MADTHDELMEEVVQAARDFVAQSRNGLFRDVESYKKALFDAVDRYEGDLP